MIYFPISGVTKADTHPAAETAPLPVREGEELTHPAAETATLPKREGEELTECRGCLPGFDIFRTIV